VGDLVLSTPTDPGTAAFTDVDVLIAAAPGAAWPGQVGVQGVVVDTLPADGETYTVQLGSSSTVVYTFKTTAVVATDVALGGSVAACQSNLETALIANQGTWATFIDYGAPSALYMYAFVVADVITQTDGTGGNLDLYQDPSLGFGFLDIGPGNLTPEIVAPFHIAYQVQSQNLTDGDIYFAFPMGYEPFAFSAVAARGKGADNKSMENYAFTGSVASAQDLSGQWVIVISNGGATTFANGDWFTLWGMMKSTA
jgi:hypothetical protein